MTSTITIERQMLDSWAVRAVNDPEAFALLYDEFFPRLYKYAFYRLGDAAMAEDLVADVFERIFEQLPTFNPTIAPIGAWIFGIARHTLVDLLRKQRRNQIISFRWLGKSQSSSPEAESTAMEGDEKASLHAALKQLAARELDVLSLKFASGLTNRQIAPLLGLSESNVGVILHRALHKLRHDLNSSEEK